MGIALLGIAPGTGVVRSRDLGERRCMLVLCARMVDLSVVCVSGYALVWGTVTGALVDVSNCVSFPPGRCRWM
jgi:hypothetical protein